MACNCSICTYSRLFRSKLAELPEDKREFFEDLYDRLIHVEMDKDYYQAIINGTWPDADEIIQQRRKRIANA